MEVKFLLQCKNCKLMLRLIILFLTTLFLGEEFTLIKKSMAAASSGVENESITRRERTSSGARSSCGNGGDTICYDLAGTLNDANVDSTDGRKFSDDNLSMKKISEDATFADFQKYFGYGWQALKFIIRAAEMKSTKANQHCRIDNIFFTMFDQFTIVTAALRLANFVILIEEQMKLTKKLIEEIEKNSPFNSELARIDDTKLKHTKFLDFLIRLQVISVKMSMIDWIADVLDLVNSAADLVAAFIDMVRVGYGYCVPKPIAP
jgi:hypothetical protein